MATLQPTAAPAATPKEVDAGPQLGDSVIIRAVYGRMVNPINNESYDQERGVLTKLDWWNKMQADHGKLLINPSPDKA